jgi:hypothetical protein
MLETVTVLMGKTDGKHPQADTIFEGDNQPELHIDGIDITDRVNYRGKRDEGGIVVATLEVKRSVNIFEFAIMCNNKSKVIRLYGIGFSWTETTNRTPSGATLYKDDKLWR